MTDTGPAAPATLGEWWRRVSTEIGARHQARWLCETASGLDGAAFDAALDEPVGDRMVEHLETMLARYRLGEPLQYVLGRWAFRHLDLAIDQRVLIPRPETELVAEVAIGLAAEMSPTRMVADLGTGSGAIGLAMAVELPRDGTTVWLTDASAAALDVARANLAGIGRAATNVRLAEGVWCDALPADVLFDLIVSNPPYVAAGSPDLAGAVADWEPAAALFSGPEGLDDITILVGQAPGRLRAGGWLVLEIGADQGARVVDLFARAGFAEVEIRQDLAGHDRIALGRTLVA